MRLAALACSAFLVGSPLLGQLQFLNTDTYWFNAPPTIVTDSAGDTYVLSSAGSGGITATKLDSSHNVVWSFSAPSMVGQVTSAAVDSHGSLIFGGSAASAMTFPRVNPLFYPRLPTANPDYRGFVAKLDPGGTTLMFSTLVGGSELVYYGTSVTALAVDSADRIYVSGSTSSPTFPVSSNAFQKTGGAPAGTSAFVMRISNAGDALQFSTYLGAADPACRGCGTSAQAIVVDGHGITVAGTSGAKGFPVTKGSYDCQCGAGMFVSRFNADASALEWSTILFDPGVLFSVVPPPPVPGLVVDPQGNATVAATTTNPALAVTPGGLQTAYRVVLPSAYGSYGPTTGFLSTVSSDGTTVLHSTYYGGAAPSTLRGLVQDPDGNYWITGEANSMDLPKPAGSLDLGSGYLAELDSSLTRVLRYYGIYNGAVGQTLNILPNRDLLLSGAANSVLTIPGNGPTQPSVWAVGGAAEPAATPHISAGELIGIYGMQIGPDPGVSGSLDATGKVATDIAGYEVMVNGTPAPLLYAGPNQINLVVPFGVAKDTEASIQVITPTERLTPVTGLSVGPSEPQLFPVMVNEDGSINSNDHPAPRNSIVTIWATGGGAMDRGMVDGQISQPPLGNLLLPVEIRLGRLSMPDYGEVTYAGAAPGMVAGVVQINFRVPPARQGYGSCHGSCDVILIIDGQYSFATFPFTVFNEPDPLLWVVD